MVLHDLRHLCAVLLKKQTCDLSNENGEGYGALLSAAELGRSHVMKTSLEQNNLQALITSDRISLLHLSPGLPGLVTALLFGSHSKAPESLANKTVPRVFLLCLVQSPNIAEDRNPLIDGIRAMELPLNLPLVAVLSNT